MIESHMVCRGIRGATTVEIDNPVEIDKATRALMELICEKNELQASNVGSVFVTCTPDLTSCFPAKTIRNLKGWSAVPIISAVEMDVEGSLSKCIRVLLHINTHKGQDEITHVYQNKAVHLRPDLHSNS